MCLLPRVRAVIAKRGIGRVWHNTNTIQDDGSSVDALKYSHGDYIRFFFFRENQFLLASFY